VQKNLSTGKTHNSGQKQAIPTSKTSNTKTLKIMPGGQYEKKFHFLLFFEKILDILMKMAKLVIAQLKKRFLGHKALKNCN